MYMQLVDVCGDSANSGTVITVLRNVALYYLWRFSFYWEKDIVKSTMFLRTFELPSTFSLPYLTLTLPASLYCCTRHCF